MRQPLTPNLTPNAADSRQLDAVRIWQAHTARYLAAQGVYGPFEIDNKLYDICLETGAQKYLATRTHHPEQDDYRWLNEDTGLEIKDKYFNQCAEAQSGEPISGPSGSFKGFQSDPQLSTIRLAVPIQRVPSARPSTSPPKSGTQSSPLRTDADPMWSPEDDEDSDMLH